MWKYILKKILLAVPVLLGITIIDYAIMSLAGSPLDMMVGPRISEAAVASRAAQWGLDQPVYVQYWHWLVEVFHGNLGYSYKSYQPVADLIRSHVGPTLLLMGVSMRYTGMKNGIMRSFLPPSSSRASRDSSSP